MQVWKTLGRPPKELLDQPPFPEDIGYLWKWFLELQGSAELTYTEIKNWSELTGREILAWEVDVLKALHRRAMRG